jgi:hypothetical protein
LNRKQSGDPAGQHHLHLDPVGEPQQEFHQEQLAVRRGIDQQLAQVQRRTHAGR